MDGRLAGARDNNGMALLGRRPLANGVPHTDRRNDYKDRFVRRRHLFCRRGAISAEASVRSRTTVAGDGRGISYLIH
jgi:hypothetical protein